MAPIPKHGVSENRVAGQFKQKNFESMPSHCERSAQLTIPSSVSSVAFLSTKAPISTPAIDTLDNESGVGNPFDEAREIERRRAPHSNSQPTAHGKTVKPSYAAYVVFHGRALGIFYNWAACERSVIRFPGQRYKGYYTIQEAEDAWEHANGVGNIGPVTAATATGTSTRTKFNHVLSDEEAYWAVLRGQHPGVYHGLKTAKEACGKVEGRWLVIRALTEDEGCRAFTKGYMGGRVVALPRRTW